MPSGSGGYAVYSEASGLGLGCILIQHRKVIAYGSKQSKVHERNYFTHDLELAAMIYALKLWWHYLYGETFDVYINHKSLQYLHSKSSICDRGGGWIF